MWFAARVARLGGLGLLLLTGCNGNPFAQGRAPGKNALQQQAQAMTPQDAQVAELNRRTGQLDANNRDLTTQMAQFQQQLQTEKQALLNEKEYTASLRKQLADTAKRLEEAQIAKQEAEKKSETMQASMQKRGGAILTANNSLRQSLRAIEIPGVEVRADEEVIRVELPADQLFQPGTANLQPGSLPLLDQVSAALAANYGRQKISIEAHTDIAPQGAVGVGSTSAHQITAAQANAVLEYFAQRGRLSPAQLFSVAHGANIPLYSNVSDGGRKKNRRVEIVVHPETLSGR